MTWNVSIKIAINKGHEMLQSKLIENEPEIPNIPGLKM